MRQRFIFFSILFALGMASTASGGAPIDTIIKWDTTFSARVQTFREAMTTKLMLNNSGVSFFVDQPSSADYKIDQNTFVAISGVWAFRYLSLQFGIAPRFLPGNNDDPLKGKSSTWSVSGAGLFKHWSLAGSVTDVKGFYLRNTSDYIPGWKEGTDAYITFPELTYLGFTGRIGYLFNTDYSLRAVVTQTERQTRSAGSFFPQLFSTYYIVDNKVELTGTASSQKSNNFQFAVLAGYYHTFVYRRRFYFSAGGAFGAGAINTRLLTRWVDDQVVSEEWDPAYRGEVQFALGYNSKVWFAGTETRITRNMHDQNNSAVYLSDQNISWQVFVGRRFLAPRLLRKSVNYAEDVGGRIVKRK